MVKHPLEYIKDTLTRVSQGRYTFELTEYSNYKQKINCKCSYCNHIWEASIDHLIDRKSACPYHCYNKQNKTRTEIVSETLMKIPQDKYIMTVTTPIIRNINNLKIKCKCNKCGYEWERDYRYIKKGKIDKCCQCKTQEQKKSEKPTKTQIMIQRLEKSAQQGNYTFKPFQTYTNQYQRVYCKCNKCGYEWDATYWSLRQGTSCRVCANNNRRLDVDLIEQNIKNKFDNIQVLQIEKHPKGHLVTYKCGTCGDSHTTRYDSLIKQKYGCRKCSDKYKALTLGEATQKLTEASQGRYTFELKCFENTNQKIKCKCNKCQHEWDSLFTNLAYNNQGCPKCPSKISSYELHIRDLLQNKNIVYNDRSVLKPFELDILDTNKKIAIEINGVYWHRESHNPKYKTLHLNKTLGVEAKGIKLLHIFENELIHKKDIWESLICDSFGIQEHITTLHARKCTVKEINNLTAKQFCNENHLQSGINSKVNIGAYHESQLVAVMTFGVPRYNKNYEWELLRFCSLKFHRIRGIASKLLAYFKRSYEPTSIISYGNRRWCSSLSNVYQKMGFQYKGSSAPNYFYVKGSELHSRLQFQKHKLGAKLEVFNPELTEYENMLLNGYDRIWDCGNLIYEWRQ